MGDGFAVISDWDESGGGFEGQRLLRNPESSLETESRSEEGAPWQTYREMRFMCARTAVVARVVAGETLIVPVRAKVGDLASIYSFNGTGTLIWKLLESPRTVAQLATAVAEAYEVDRARAERDVTDFVSEMKSAGLVEVPAAVAMAGD